MKKIILAAVLFSITGIASAQTRWGVKAGGNLNNLKYKFSGDGGSASIDGNNIGFHAGVVADFKVSEKFSIQPQLLYALRGGDLSHELFNGVKVKTQLHYIDLPVNFLYHSKGFFIGGGPNFSYGISGKAKAQGEQADLYDQSESETLALKRFELGLNLTAGYELPSGLFFSANFTQGLTNISNAPTDPGYSIKAHTNTLGVTIGYFFKTAKKSGK